MDERRDRRGYQVKIIGSYTFNIVVAASVLLSIATSLIGSINVFKKQSLIGMP